MVAEIQPSASTKTRSLWMVINEGKLPTVNLILILMHFNSKSVTQKWQFCYTSQWMFENPINFSALWNLCVNTACCLSELIFTLLHGGSNIQNAGEQFVLYIHFLYTLLFIQPLKQKSNGVRSGNSNHSELDTCSHELFVSQWPILPPPKTITFPFKSPCIRHNIIVSKNYNIWQSFSPGS